MDNLVFKGNPTLQTERLLLRKINFHDENDIFEYASNEEVTRYMLWDTHLSLEQTRAFISYVQSRYERDEAGEWGIVLKASGKLIGAMGFAACDMKNLRAEIGYVLSRSYWGLSIMPEAVNAVLVFAFMNMGINRVECCHFSENEKSGRVMQKVGMSFEGTAREKFFAKGRYWDVRQYAILKQDWLKKQ